MPPREFGMTPEQSRAGRSMLGWTAKMLAGSAGVNISTIYRFENLSVHTSDDIQSKLKRALEKGGVQFIEKGVKLNGST